VQASRPEDAEAGLINESDGRGVPNVPLTSSDMVVASLHESVTTAVGQITDLLRRRRILL
jgi:hypothetical protein